jgi:hypothetical protein
MRQSKARHKALHGMEAKADNSITNHSCTAKMIRSKTVYGKWKKKGSDARKFTKVY